VVVKKIRDSRLAREAEQLISGMPGATTAELIEVLEGWFEGYAEMSTARLELAIAAAFRKRALTFALRRNAIALRRTAKR
jgi:hypothetical protein